jgi:hypothetical protein
MYSSPGNKQNASHKVVIGPAIEKGVENDFQFCTGHFK